LRKLELSDDESSILMKQLAELEGPEYRIYGFKSIIKGADDFYFGCHDLKKSEIFLAEDLMQELMTRGPPSLFDEYLLHELLCPLLGHYRAILIQQSLFPAHYPLAENIEKQALDKPYKGLLGTAIRQKITIYASTPHVIILKMREEMDEARYALQVLPQYIRLVVEAHSSGASMMKKAVSYYFSSDLLKRLDESVKILDAYADELKKRLQKQKETDDLGAFTGGQVYELEELIEKISQARKELEKFEGSLGSGRLKQIKVLHELGRRLSADAMILGMLKMEDPVKFIEAAKRKKEDEDAKSGAKLPANRFDIIKRGQAIENEIGNFMAIPITSKTTAEKLEKRAAGIQRHINALRKDETALGKNRRGYASGTGVVWDADNIPTPVSDKLEGIVKNALEALTKIAQKEANRKKRAPAEMKPARRVRKNIKFGKGSGGVSESSVAEIIRQYLGEHPELAGLSSDKLLPHLTEILAAVPEKNRSAYIEEALKPATGPPLSQSTSNRPDASADSAAAESRGIVSPSGALPKSHKVDEYREARALMRSMKDLSGVPVLIHSHKYSIGEKDCDVERTGDGSLYRIGPLIFYIMWDVSKDRSAALSDEELAALPDEIRKYKDKCRQMLGDSRDKFGSEALLAYPFSNVKFLPIDGHMAALIAAMVSYKDNFKGAAVIDMGAGAGMMSLAALALGAKHVYLIDNDKVKTALAGRLLEAHGWKEGPQGSGDFTILEADLTQKETVKEMLAGPVSREAGPVIGIANIGPWPTYGNANRAALEIMAELPRLGVIFNSGYRTRRPEDQTAEFIDTVERLKGQGFSVSAYRQHGAGFLVAVPEAKIIAGASPATEAEMPKQAETAYTQPAPVILSEFAPAGAHTLGTYSSPEVDYVVKAIQGEDVFEYYQKMRTAIGELAASYECVRNYELKTADYAWTIPWAIVQKKVPIIGDVLD
ncbi:MAG: 50S ribosomal protein L11 methyltransferase, partial [Candidatus Omnitrophica bacterium]|nr:50S ribosomal protein L11 methyltransferase [Candidatus Omnitrophota bacterium]